MDGLVKVNLYDIITFFLLMVYLLYFEINYLELASNVKILSVAW
jgi:hypothetical protein